MFMYVDCCSPHYPQFCFYITPAVFQRFAIGPQWSRDDGDDQSATTSWRSCYCTTESRVSGGQKVSESGLDTDTACTSDANQSTDDDNDDDDDDVDDDEVDDDDDDDDDCSSRS